MPNNKYLLTREGNFVTVSDDELYHHKYIKREKVNGKWRYYYKDDKYDNAKQEYQDAQRETQFRKDQAWLTNKQLTDAWEKVEAIRKTGLDYFDDERHRIEYHYDSVGEQNIKAHERAEEARRNEKVAQQKFEKIRKTYESSFGHTVADFLNRSSDKIDNAKAWVSGLFSKKKK